MTTSSELTDLVGMELSAVCFVRDYVEFHFDGPILRAFSDPIVSFAESSFEFPLPGARDAMCGLIGEVVRRAAESEDSLSIGFGNSNDIVVPKRSDLAGEEIAHLIPQIDGRLEVSGMTIWENSLRSI